MNNIDKARGIIGSVIDAVKLEQVAGIISKGDYLLNFIHHGCPSNAGLEVDCTQSCLGCWEQALEQFNSPFARSRTKLEIIEDKGITVALIKNDAGKVVRKGIAKRHVDDTHNRAVGVMVAVSRAMGFDMNRTLEFFTDKELAKELFDRL